MKTKNQSIPSARSGKSAGRTPNNAIRLRLQAWALPGLLFIALCTLSPSEGAITRSRSADSPEVSLWLGRWDTHTDGGGHFELIFETYGDQLKGTLRDLNGNSQYNGQLLGSLARGFILKYRCAQYDIKTTSEGVFKLDPSQTKLTGYGVAKGPAGSTKYRWWGVRVQ